MIQPVTSSQDPTAEVLMSGQRTLLGTIFALLTAALGLAGCASDDAITESPGGNRAAAAATSESVPLFGPFPDGTTIFADVDNTTGVEDGSQGHPFNTVREAIAAAKSGDVVGVAPGVY